MVGHITLSTENPVCSVGFDGFLFWPQDEGRNWDIVEDQNEINEKIRQHMIDMANEKISPQDNQAQQLEEQPEAQHVPREIQSFPLDNLDLFDELNNYYLEEVWYRDYNNNDLAVVAPIAHAGDAVLSLYRQEPGIRLTNDDGTFTCPLTWWKFNEKWKLLSTLAGRVLCISATLAPSACVFSIVGLTIAQDHARLACDTAIELIFLHDALPAIHH